MEYVFRIAAENEAGIGEFSAESSPTLISIGEAPTFTQRLVDQTVTEEEDISLICQVVGQPSPTVRWIKDTTELRRDDRTEIKTEESTHQIIIKKASADDGGTYR